MYGVKTLPAYDAAFYDTVRANMTKLDEAIVPAREARVVEVPAGHVFRIVSVEGPQVGDLNLWNAHDLGERFFSGKTRAFPSPRRRGEGERSAARFTMREKKHTQLSPRAHVRA